jgi:heme-degrading monooxygenase HmoA
VSANGGSTTGSRKPDGSVLRLFRFRPAHGEFDRVLRTKMLPDLRKLPGLVDVHIGRHGSSELGDRVVASVWQDRDAMVRAMGASLSTSTFHPEHMSETTDQVLEVHELAFAIRFAPPSAATVLRLFRGRVRPGELEPYIEDSRAGTIADTEAGRGPNAIYLAPVEADRFVTLSLWRSWDAIETATGGDVHRPIVTKDPRRIVEMDVIHYEVIPEIA